ncbi:unnamed protein product [Lactuca virosa]|uniref:PRA1 family protein n=1 Tax=Lactuca virosa TaxID=75947 RepID=A0AAU9NF20_9ASTR|nr:unnamed protein product [Lactuca virosa]
MCSCPIIKLTPEATLSQQQDAGIHDVLKNVRHYNCLFAGGACIFILVFLGALYTLSPFDFLPRCSKTFPWQVPMVPSKRAFSRTLLIVQGDASQDHSSTL